MGLIALDTLALVKKLKAANFTEEQAEALAESVAGIIEGELAQKRDLKELEAGLKRDLKELETTLKRDLKELEAKLERDHKELEVKVERELKELEMRLKYDLTLRLGGMLAAGIALVAALVKLL